MQLVGARMAKDEGGVAKAYGIVITYRLICGGVGMPPNCAHAHALASFDGLHFHCRFIHVILCMPFSRFIEEIRCADATGAAEAPCLYGVGSAASHIDVYCGCVIIR